MAGAGGKRSLASFGRTVIIALTLGMALAAGVLFVANPNFRFDLRNFAGTPSTLTAPDFASTPDALLQPVNAPFLYSGWKWYMESGYDRSGGNKDGFNADSTMTAFKREGDAWVLIDKQNVSGVITRIWMADRVPWLYPNEQQLATLSIYTDNSSTPLTLNIRDAAKANQAPFVYPLIADAGYSSGGVVSYTPIAFHGRLKVVADRNPRYIHINYKVATTGSVGSVTDAVRVAQTWRPDRMGDAADALSPDGTGFGGVSSDSKAVTVPGNGKATVYQQAGAGIITKIAFPAGKLTPNINNLRLRVTYPDTDQASVTLPFAMLFRHKNDNYIPDPPPTTSITQQVFSPTGKEIIIAGNTVWIKEMWLEDPTRVGEVPGWYRLSLAEFLRGTGEVPPTDAIDAYAIRPDTSQEYVIKGSRYWTRTHVSQPWKSGSLADLWPAGPNGVAPPRSGIDSYAFQLDGNESVIAGDRYWARPKGGSTWYSNTNQSAWKFSPSKVDSQSFSAHGETIISGSTYWFRVKSTDDFYQGDLAKIWKTDNLFYGSLFFGYDGRTDQFYLTWPMPFGNGVTVSLENTSGASAPVDVTVSHTTQTYDRSQAGYMNASYVTGKEDAAHRVFTMADITGRGKLVSIIYKISEPPGPQANKSYLEGDHLVWVDGQKVANGTGTEDIFNGGWYFLHGPTYLPLSGAVRSPATRLWTFKKKGTWGPDYLGELNPFDNMSIFYRHFLGDAIDFNSRLFFQIETSGTPLERLNQGLQTSAEGIAVSYLYVAPPANQSAGTQNAVINPTAAPTKAPTRAPTRAPTPRPTPGPTNRPTVTPTPKPSGARTALYQLYRSDWKDHFYTTDTAEKDKLVTEYKTCADKNACYLYQLTLGYPYKAAGAGRVPIYRFYNNGWTDHFYTTDTAEKDRLVAAYQANPTDAYYFEGVIGYLAAEEEPGTLPVYRYYKPDAAWHDHFYATDQWERRIAKDLGYTEEGVIGYIPVNP